MVRGLGGALVLVPAFNEAATIESVIQSVQQAGMQILVVDDGSSDDTFQRCVSAGAIVLRLSRNLGVGGALRCGFRYAVDHGYSQVFQCDGDGQHDPKQFDLLASAADQNQSDLVIGSRFSGSRSGFQATRIRRIAISYLSGIATQATGVTVTDASSGFRLVRSPLLNQFAREFPAHYLGDTFEVVVAAGRAGYRVCEVPVVMNERQGGAPSSGTIASVKFLIRAVIVVWLKSSISYPPRGA